MLPKIRNPSPLAILRISTLWSLVIIISSFLTLVPIPLSYAQVVTGFQLPHGLAAVELKWTGSQPANADIVREFSGWEPGLFVDQTPNRSFGIAIENQRPTPCEICPGCLLCPSDPIDLSAPIYRAPVTVTNIEDYFTAELSEEFRARFDAVSCTNTYEAEWTCNSIVPPDCKITLKCTTSCSSPEENSIVTVLSPPLSVPDMADTVIPWLNNFTPLPHSPTLEYLPNENRFLREY